MCRHSDEVSNLGCWSGVSSAIPVWVGSGNINSFSPPLVYKSDTFSLPSQTVRYTQLWEIEECEWYFCNRCWSLHFTITLSLTASAGPCLVNQLLRTYRKMALFLTWAGPHIVCLQSSVRTHLGFSPPGTVFTLPFIVLWWDCYTSNWIPPLLPGLLQSLLPLIWAPVWY